MLLNINNFLLLENIKQSKELLSKLGKKPESEQDFLDITKALNRMPNLVYNFVNFRYNQNINIEEIKKTINWILTHNDLVKKLPKNIIQYTDFEELQDDIKIISNETLIHQFYKSLYISMREKIEKLPETEKQEFDGIALSFMKLDKNAKDKFTPLKHFEINKISLADFKKALINFIEKHDVNGDENKILEKINSFGDKVKIIYNENKILVLETEDSKAICELGSSSWCLVYSNSQYQEKYLNESDFNTQYIIFNFNLPTTSDNFQFGLTIDTNDDTLYGACQNKVNKPTTISDIQTMTGIPDNILVSRKKDEKREFNKESDIVTQAILDVKNKIIDIDEYMNIIKDLKFKNLILPKKSSNFIASIGDVVYDFISNKINISKNVFDVYDKYMFILDSIDITKLMAKFTDIKIIVDLYIIYIIRFCKKNGNHKSLITDNLIDYFLKTYKEKLKDIFIPYEDYYKKTIVDLFKKYTEFKENFDDNRDMIINEYSLKNFIDKNIESLLKEGDDYFDTWDEYKIAYDKLINDDYDIFIEKWYIGNCVKHYFNEINFTNFLIEHFINDDFIDNMNDLIREIIEENSLFDNKEFRLFIAKLINNYLTKYELTIENLDEKLSTSTILYCLYENKDNENITEEQKTDYKNSFIKNIKMNVDELGRTYVKFDDWAELEDFYSETVGFKDSDYMEYFQGYERSEYSEWSSSISDLSLTNIINLSKIFKKAGFDINQNMISKYDNIKQFKLYNTVYKTKQLLREDKELNNLLNVIEDIIKDYNNYDSYEEELYNNLDFDSLYDSFSESYTRAKESSDAEEFFDRAVDALDTIFDKWNDDSDGEYKNKLYKFIKGTDGILFRINDIKQLMSNMNMSDLHYSYGKDFDINEIISEYFNQNGKLSFNRDNIYSNFDKDYFNDELFNQLVENNLIVDDETPNESIIVKKYNDFINEIYKNI